VYREPFASKQQSAPYGRVAPVRDEKLSAAADHQIPSGIECFCSREREVPESECDP